MTRKSQCCLAVIAAIGSFMALPALAAKISSVTFTLNTSCTTTPDGQSQTVSAGTNAPLNGASQECYIFKDAAGHILTNPTTGQPNTNGGLYPAVAGDNEFACTPTFPTNSTSPFAFRLPPGTWTLMVWSPPDRLAGKWLSIRHRRGFFRVHPFRQCCLSGGRVSGCSEVHVYGICDVQDGNPRRVRP